MNNLLFKCDFHCKAGALLLSLLTLAACSSAPPLIDSRQEVAMQTALKRGQFELNCPQATGTILSRQVLQPPITTVRFRGIQRAEYTIGVSGCDQRMTYIVVCAEGNEGCIAAAGHTQPLR